MGNLIWALAVVALLVTEKIGFIVFIVLIAVPWVWVGGMWLLTISIMALAAWYNGRDR